MLNNLFIITNHIEVMMNASSKKTKKRLDGLLAKEKSKKDIS